MCGLAKKVWLRCCCCGSGAVAQQYIGGRSDDEPVPTAVTPSPLSMHARTHLLDMFVLMVKLVQDLKSLY
jgi:hypothetical protein